MENMMIDAEYDYTSLVVAWFTGEMEWCGRTFAEWLESGEEAVVSFGIKDGKIVYGSVTQKKGK